MAIDARNKQGLYGEFLVMADLVKRGFEVAEPRFAGSVYDLIASKGGPLIKLQVKCSNPNERGKIVCDIRKSHANDRLYTSSDFDVLAVVDYEKGLIAYMSYKEVAGKTRVSIWNKTPQSMSGFGGSQKLRLFDEYKSFPGEYAS